MRTLISLTESGYYTPSQYQVTRESALEFNGQVAEKRMNAEVVANY